MAVGLHALRAILRVLDAALPCRSVYLQPALYMDDLANYIKGKDSPPVWSFFPLSAFYCDKGLLSFFVQSLVDLFVRLRHGRRSETAAKIALTCTVRRLNGLLLKADPESVGVARRLLHEAVRSAHQNHLAPLYCLDGKIMLFHMTPPDAHAALHSYEKAIALLNVSPYLSLLAQPHHLLFGAAMAATLCKKPRQATKYMQCYKEFVRHYPKKRWGEDIEADLQMRIDKLTAIKSSRKK